MRVLKLLSHGRIDRHKRSRATCHAHLLACGEAPNRINEAGYQEETPEHQLDQDAAGSVGFPETLRATLRADESRLVYLSSSLKLLAERV
jgi:hypothetical protein